MYEWPGYGKAPGIPTQNRVFDAIRATYNYLTEVIEVDPKTIILYGMSLGTGPTLWLASQVLVGGVVLQSGFTSICRVLSSHFGCKGSCPCCIPRCSEFCDLFDNLNAAGQIRCPVYVMHSKSDEVIVISNEIAKILSGGII
eukprot:jgi/Bigna1/52106/estExt_Genewise1Plus.C_50192